MLSRSEAAGACFNPRVLAGGRDVQRLLHVAKKRVSIHASSREDATKYPLVDFDGKRFNPRVLAGGRD